MKFTNYNVLRFYLTALSIIIFCNLNGVANMIFGLDAPFSLVILWLSLSIIYLGIVKFKVSLKNRLLSKVVYFFLAYLSLASLSLLFDSSNLHEKTSLLLMFRTYLSSIIVILAYYIGF